MINFFDLKYIVILNKNGIYSTKRSRIEKYKYGN